MITLKQFAGATIKPLDDAILYDFIVHAIGMISGGVVSFVTANQVAITAGRGIIYGRTFEIAAETILVNLASSGSMNGQLYIEIDLTNATTPIAFKSEAAASLTPLVQEDLNASGTVYQLLLATYTVSTTTISAFVVTPVTALPPADRPKVYAVTLASADWSTDVQTLAVANVASTHLVGYGLPDMVTKEQLLALSNAQVMITGGGAGTVEFTAFGGAPTIDIPILIIDHGVPA